MVAIGVARRRRRRCPTAGRPRRAPTRADEPEHREPKQRPGPAERQQHLAVQRLQRLDESRPRRGSGSPASPRSSAAPSTTSTKSGATMTSPTSAGIEIAPTSRVARIQMSAIRSRSSLIRENAGKKTCCSGAGDACERHQDHVRRERVRAERRRAEDAADQDACATVPAGLVEEVLAEDVAGEAAEPAQARDRERERRAPRRQQPERGPSRRTPRRAAGRRSPRRRSRASAIAMPTAAPTSVAAIWRSSRRRNCISRTSSAICVVPERADEEARPRAPTKSQRTSRLAVEVGERAGEGDADERQQRGRRRR